MDKSKKEYTVDDLIEKLNDLKRREALTGNENVIIFDKNGNQIGLTIIRLNNKNNEILLEH